MHNIAKKVIHDHPKSFISMVLLIILSIITSLLPPLALEQIVNHLMDQKGVSLLFALAYLGLIVLFDLFASAQNISITIFGQKLTHGVRSALVQKLNTITTGYLTNHESGSIDSVFVNDADTINSLYSEGVVGMIADLFQLIGLLLAGQRLFTNHPDHRSRRYRPTDDRGRPRAEDADFLWHQCRQRRGIDRLCRADFYTAGINRDGNPKHPRCHGRDEPDPGLFK
ncbi:ABC transporter transmembrane domain-containing protein [Lactobacillus delbrueckii]|uniref:ABC transporter transmembrane domain-containing protein n=1 Tax=Lactobacillus delbrueckii TaxID=1584 RepID=UPI001F5C8864|nr:ABC transporter transmembrane domain-containing protein [Lactobacillus delbrueckii]